MNKIIIENRTKYSMPGILKCIDNVIRMGKISKTGKGEQYCFVTTFKPDIIVYADKNKKSDRFIIDYDKRKHKQ